MTRALVLGYDGSECADTALAVAIDVADLTGDKVLITFGYEPGHYGEEHAAHRDEVRKFGERATAPALERAVGSVPHKLLQISERPVLVVPVREG